MLGLRHINRKHGSNSDLIRITDLSVVPRLTSEDPCCQIVLDSGHFITQDYGYWLEMILVSDVCLNAIKSSLFQGNIPISSLSAFPIIVPTRISLSLVFHQRPTSTLFSSCLFYHIPLFQFHQNPRVSTISDFPLYELHYNSYYQLHWNTLYQPY